MDSEKERRGYAKRKIRFARELRKDMTPEEKILWKVLRYRQANGLKFRRQAPFGPYILDFVCFTHKLVVEVDGSIHEVMKEYDAARDRFLTECGFLVIRYSNEEVRTSLLFVLMKICTAARSERPSQFPRSTGTKHFMGGTIRAKKK